MIETEGELSRLGFGDAKAVAADLKLLRSGPLSRKADEILSLALKSPSPDAAVRNIERVAALKDAASLDKFLSCADNLQRLSVICGSSEFLTNVLCKTPAFFDELFNGGLLMESKDYDRFRRELGERVGDVEEQRAAEKALRLYKEREYLRIGSRDLLGLATMSEVTAELADLAGAALDAAHSFALCRMKKQYGEPLYKGEDGSVREAGLAVIGMGKLGGRELNFSSDIDIIYIYTTERGETTGGAGGPGSKIGLHAFFVKLAERISRLIGSITEDGFVFRVDLDLRPDGKGGEMANSLRSAEIYYESWGRCWERSAMIKARPVAGSMEVGAEFLALMGPFVYRRHLDFTAIEEMKGMKEKIDLALLRKSPDVIDVKLGAGGIREIEFFCQALQLIHGGKSRLVREKGTLRALDALEREGFLPTGHAKNLREAYVFLRNVEHRIQLVEGRQTHALPAGTAQVSRLARAMGCHGSAGESPADEFRRVYGLLTGRVYDVYRTLFYSPAEEYEGAVSDEVRVALSPDSDQDLVRDILAQMGFSDPGASMGHINALMRGTRLTGRAAVLIEKLAPHMLERIVRAPDRDRALAHLSALVSSIGAKETFFSLLAQNVRVADLLIDIFGTSEFLSSTLLSQPGAVEHLLGRDITRPFKTKAEMLDDFNKAVEGLDDYESILDGLRRVRNQEIFRIGINDVLGGLDARSVSDQMTALAEAALDAVLELSVAELSARYGRPKPEGDLFAVIGLGKLGSGELGYGSDLDIIFVYADADRDGETSGPKRITNQEYFIKLGQRIISMMTLKTREGGLFSVDMRLRPTGSAGPLVLSRSGFLRYQSETAAVWEAQAMTRARFVAGDIEFGDGVIKELQEIIYSKKLSADDRSEIARVRQRMEDELAKEGRGTYNIKTGRGGITDIEFVVQTLQLEHGFDRPAIRTTRTADALKALCAEGFLSEGDFKALSEAHEFLKILESKLRIVHDRAEGRIREGVELSALAKRVGYEGKDNTARLMRDYLAHTSKVREIFLSVCKAN